MIFFLIVANAMVAVSVVFLVARDNRTGSVPLFCCRNLFLLGFLYFQNFGLNIWLLNRRGFSLWAYKISDPGSMTSLKYIGLEILCLVFLFASYRFFSPRFRETEIIEPQEIGTHTLFWHSVGLSLAATIVWGLGFIAMPDLMLYASSGIGATATGMAGYAWFRDRQNVFLMWVFLAVLAASCVPHLTEYGRRGLLSLALIVAWVGHLQFMANVNLPKLAMTVVLLTSPMIILLAAFSEARVRHPRTVSQSIEYMMEADIGHGLQRLANFQGSATISLWCMENYPKRFAYRHLYSARATVHYFVPRAYWRDKPEGLGIQIPGQARLRNVGGLNVGAGLIGHAMCEGGAYALVIYAILIGYGLKWMDGYIDSRRHLIYTLPMLSGLGQLFAIPRGEVNFFIDTMVIGIVCSIVCMKIMHRLVPISSKPVAYGNPSDPSTY
ncbi:hypothetical protein Enr13x_40620 [Stieleria neptunia]|uniref:Uncharacterized protein n=1 Tax=Stieleria neptunia TaxID=2527979 RepID=A0A518HTL0_9BACT|nr:hypothetical protein [Stieleria neptunia]QDV44200.1 hypothetical protein Enr13x_40620 [Stieleria neptunia]